jgi:hypothetical protein
MSTVLARPYTPAMIATCQKLDVAAVDERGQQQRLHAHHRLREDDQPALGQPVGHGAGEERQEEDRRELQRAHQAEQER